MKIPRHRTVLSLNRPASCGAIRFGFLERVGTLRLDALNFSTGTRSSICRRISTCVPISFIFPSWDGRTSVSQNETSQSSYILYIQRPSRSQTHHNPVDKWSNLRPWLEILTVRSGVMSLSVYITVFALHQITAGERRKKNFHLSSIVPLAMVGVEIATKAKKRKKLWHRQHSQPVFRS